MRLAYYKGRKQEIPVVVKDDLAIKLENILECVEGKCAHSEIRIFLAVIFTS